MNILLWDTSNPTYYKIGVFELQVAKNEYPSGVICLKEVGMGPENEYILEQRERS